MDAPQTHLNMAHSLYALYETLLDNVQREFLTELWQKQRQTFEDLALYLECKQAKDDNEFLNEAETQAFIQSLG
jgi:hypothetical protein